MSYSTINGVLYAGMVQAGAAMLHQHVEEVNDLNVFPIPDGDTGENMMLTMQGGRARTKGASSDLSVAAKQIADGMLLGARGNSGVILSQFFAGLAEGFLSEEADAAALEGAMACGVSRAFEAVLTPAPGTILTVMHDAANYAGNLGCESIDAYFEAFLAEGRRALDRTPELLPILKEAGVVDSGGAGFLYVIEGMYAHLCGKVVEDTLPTPVAAAHTVDPDLFGEDSVMEFGYCTELLVRLQTAKTDIEHFEVEPVTDFLQSIGNSVATVKNGSILKLHVHTMTPHRVLEYCQQYGEFLTVKIENMMLQHNETIAEEREVPEAPESSEERAAGPRREVAVVTVATGEGIRASFLEMGADEVIAGGQTMNPSAEDFLRAFDRVNADTVFVLPNNGNILLAARQAAAMYEGSDVRVIPTKSIGDGYAVLSMMELGEDTDATEESMKASMSGVLTAEISKSIRDAEINGVKVSAGDYIGFAGKRILAAGAAREEVAERVTEQLELSAHDMLLVIRGKDADEEGSARITSYVNEHYPDIEVYETDGGQDIYDYILVAE